MKKVLALLLAMVLVLSLAACGGANSENNNNSSKTSDSSSSKEENKELSDSEIKSRVEKALLEQIKTQFSEADPYSTKYSIANKKKNRKYIDVYGTCTLYDKYGKITTGYSDGSGSYTKSFEVNLSLEGFRDNCDID